jgi:hypothetical protein
MMALHASHLLPAVVFLSYSLWHVSTQALVAKNDTNILANMKNLRSCGKGVCMVLISVVSV